MTVAEPQYEVATRADLDVLRAEFRADLERLRGDMRSDMGELRGEVRAMRWTVSLVGLGVAGLMLVLRMLG